MTLPSIDWAIINKNLYVEGAKFWKSGYLNMDTGEELYRCAEYKKTKCQCTAMVRYFKSVMRMKLLVLLMKEKAMFSKKTKGSIN